MKVRIDHPLFGWSADVEMSAIPREGERLTLNGIERSVRNVIWHANEATGEAWAQLILVPSDEDREEARGTTPPPGWPDATRRTDSRDS